MVKKNNKNKEIKISQKDWELLRNYIHSVDNSKEALESAVGTLFIWYERIKMTNEE